MVWHPDVRPKLMMCVVRLEGDVPRWLRPQGIGDHARNGGGWGRRGKKKGGQGSVGVAPGNFWGVSSGNRNGVTVTAPGRAWGAPRRWSHAGPRVRLL